MKLTYSLLLLLSWMIGAISQYDADTLGRPLSIAHRGDASIFPENTLQSFDAAMYQGADFIELDVQISKEGTLVVSHDPTLSRVSNVADKIQFITKRRTHLYYGKNVTDWWVMDFTVPELQELGIKQTLVKGRITILNYLFTYPTLEQTIQEVIQFNQQHQGNRNPDNKLAGILIESKDPQFYQQEWGVQQGKMIVDLLAKYGLNNVTNASLYCPIMLHSFDSNTVQLWHNITQLYNSLLGSASDLAPYFDQIATFAKGVGLEIGGLYNNNTQQSTGYVEKAKAAGLKVHGWTFRDDQLTFGVNNRQQYWIGQKVLKLDGIIGEFPEAATNLIQVYKNATSYSQVSRDVNVPFEQQQQ